MAIFKINEIRTIAKGATGYYKTAASILTESAQKQAASKEFDIFLSHSFKDAELVLGVKIRLEQFGHSVYLDWIEDPLLDRSQINPENARLLKQRMDCCRSLFYSTTESSASSKWMPWECGYLDGKHGKVAILPLSYTGFENFAGQEYLGIYPYITEDGSQGSTQKELWVNESSDVYCSFSARLRGVMPSKRR